MANQVVKLKKGNDYLYPYADLISVDTSNILYYTGWIPTSVNYTATQDCVLIYCSEGRGNVKVNNVSLIENIWTITLNLKRGDVFYGYGAGGSSFCNCSVFGIRY